MSTVGVRDEQNFHKEEKLRKFGKNLADRNFYLALSALILFNPKIRKQFVHTSKSLKSELCHPSPDCQEDHDPGIVEAGDWEDVRRTSDDGDPG